MRPSARELQAGAGNEITHRPGDEHLPAACRRRDTGANVNRDAAELAVDSLALSRVDACADFEIELAHGASDRAGAAHRGPRPLEAGKEPVARRVEFATVEPGEQLAHAGVVFVEQLVPAAVAERARAVGGTDDVGEQDGREDPVGCGRSTRTGQKLLNLGDHRLGVAGPERVVLTSQFDQTRAGNRPRQLAASGHWENVAASMQNNRRCLNRRQDRGDVGAHARLDQRPRHRRARARARPLEEGPKTTLQLAPRARGNQLA